MRWEHSDGASRCTGLLFCGGHGCELDANCLVVVGIIKEFRLVVAHAFGGQRHHHVLVVRIAKHHSGRHEEDVSLFELHWMIMMIITSQSR
jgi:hypothetical protein